MKKRIKKKWGCGEAKWADTGRKGYDVVEVITVHIIGVDNQPTSLFTREIINLVQLLMVPIIAIGT